MSVVFKVISLILLNFCIWGLLSQVGSQLTAELDDLDRGTTPERIEFENLSNVAGDAASDLDDAEISEMDEDEWTDRNFGASTAEASSDEVSDLR